MAVPASITDLSVTDGSNFPPDSEGVTPSTRPSDYLRAHANIIRRLRAKGADVASATAASLGSNTDGDYFHVTGTTAIAAANFGTVDAGVKKTLVFDGALQLTHNATTFILPGGANITTAAGDIAEFTSEGSGNWRCTEYLKASLAPGVASSATTATSATSATTATNATNATNVTGTIASAVTATTQAAGDNSTKVATTAFMTGAFIGDNQLIAETGYQKLPGGLILQWGKAGPFTWGSGKTVSFPLIFPNAAFAGLVIGTTTSGQGEANHVVTGLSTTTLTFTNCSASSQMFYWLAIGY